MSFNDGSKEVVLVYVLEGICSYTKKKQKSMKFFLKIKELQNVLDNRKGVSMVSPWTMEKKEEQI